MFETTNQFIFITSPNYFDIISNRYLKFKWSVKLQSPILEDINWSDFSDFRPKSPKSLGLRSYCSGLGWICIPRRQVPRVENLTGGYSWGRSLRYIPHGNTWNMGETTNPLWTKSKRWPVSNHIKPGDEAKGRLPVRWDGKTSPAMEVVVLLGKKYQRPILQKWGISRIST